MFTNILVPIDGSDHAALALSEAADLAQDGRARLTLLSVVPDLSGWIVAGAAGNESSIETLTDQAETSHDRLLDEAASSIPSSIEVTKLVGHGQPGPAIVDQVRDGGHDLVVMGMRGRGDVKSLLLGSVSHYVLHASPAATLIVHVAASAKHGAPQAEQAAQA